MERYKDYGSILKLLDRIPWEHVKNKINTKNYDYMIIGNSSTGDGAGNIRVDIVRKAFIINRNGQIVQLLEDTSLASLPADKYEEIFFAPEGRVEVQYFSEI